MKMTMLTSFIIKAEGNIERRRMEFPSAASPAPVIVRIVDGIDKHEALRLLRRLSDEIEGAP